jgi:hypothetical protein
MTFDQCLNYASPLKHYKVVYTHIPMNDDYVVIFCKVC